MPSLSVREPGRLDGRRQGRRLDGCNGCGQHARRPVVDEDHVANLARVCTACARYIKCTDELQKCVREWKSDVIRSYTLVLFCCVFRGHASDRMHWQGRMTTEERQCLLAGSGFLRAQASIAINEML